LYLLADPSNHDSVIFLCDVFAVRFEYLSFAVCQDRP